jgi:predicted DCC family thiol-disulfide oxidoreductase YuxK
MNETAEHPTVLFDGVCNLCENTVRFIIRHDRNATFRFASLQSEAAQIRVSDHDYESRDLSSVLLIVNYRLYDKSRAALQILKRLDGAWPVLYYLFFWVPPFIANPVYDFIGDRRYKWFGQKEECWVPTPELTKRFLDEGAEPD